MIEKELENRLKELNIEADYNNAMQLGTKLILNATYGAFGNEYFVLSNQYIAGAITAMGRDLIQYMDDAASRYAHDVWHVDYELHEKLGLRGSPDRLDDSVVVVVYCDTDSAFFSFKKMYDSVRDICDLDPETFIHLCYEHRIRDYFVEKLDEYAARYGVKNIQDFELERINESILFTAKKMYIQHVRWEDGRKYDRMDYIMIKGLTLVRGGTPKFAREKIYEIVKYLMFNSESYTLKSLLKFVRDMKKEFELADINDICESVSLNNYEQKVVDDKNEIKYVEGDVYYMIKAAAYYNYMLNQNAEYKKVYEPLRNGMKMLTYPVQNGLEKRFAFIKDMYPKEFAPEPDYDELFLKTVLNQVNTLVKALGLPELTKRLSVVMSLFD